MLPGSLTSGWGGRIRTFEYGIQSPAPYRLATPHRPVALQAARSHRGSIAGAPEAGTAPDAPPLRSAGSASTFRLHSSQLHLRRRPHRGSPVRVTVRQLPVSGPIPGRPMLVVERMTEGLMITAGNPRGAIGKCIRWVQLPASRP